MHPSLPLATAVPADGGMSLAGKTAGSVLVAVLAVGGAFGLAAAGFAMWPDDPLLEAATPEAAERPVRLRCDTCGVVETIRHTAAVDGVAASYEFTVRLRDGSMLQSNDAQPGRWQVGDRMQLMGVPPNARPNDGPARAEARRDR